MKNLVYLACAMLALYCQPMHAMAALKSKQTEIQNVPRIFEKSTEQQFYNKIKELRKLEFQNNTSWIDRGLYTIQTIGKFKVNFDKEKTRLDTEIEQLREKISTLRKNNTNTKEEEEKLEKLKAQQKAFLPKETGYAQAFARTGLAGHNNDYVRAANDAYIGASDANKKSFNETLEDLKKYAGVSTSFFDFGGIADPETDDYKPE